MPLPYPHGTASGEIGNNALIDLGNTPGSTGGKFVGFGEEGVSSIANRASWALSENIDYVYDRLSTPFAMAEMASWTPAGGSGTKYQFTGGSTSEVWVGDPSYLPETQLKRDQLFSLLDSNFNQLIDGSSNKVVVRLVQDSTETNNVFGTGDGFETDPVIKFQTVNPSTGVVVNPSYTIPDGTAVYVVHGRYQTFENLPPDAFTKIPIRVGEEVPAGVVLQDGTRPMTGNLNLNTHLIQNITGIYGPVGDDLTIAPDAASSLFIDGSLNLDLSSIGNIDFTANSISGTLINSGDVAIQGVNNSVVGSLNNAYTLGNAVHGNRFYDVTGTITFGAAGLVTYPQLKVILNGNARIIASGSVTAPLTTHQVLVVTSAGTVAQRNLTSVVYSDIPVAHYYWSGGSTYGTSRDLRRVLFAATSALEITCGKDADGIKLPGADFSELVDAIKFASSMITIFENDGSAQRCTIRLLGYTDVASTIILPSGLTLIGEGRNAVIRATHANSVSTLNAYDSVTLNTSGYITIKNIRFKWVTAATQVSTEGAIANLGSNSQVLNCTFEKTGSYSYANAVLWNTATGQAFIKVSSCTADVLEKFVYAPNSGSLSRVTDMVIEDNDIWNTIGISSDHAIYVPSYRSVVQRNYIHDIYSLGVHHGFNAGIRIGADSIARENTVEGVETGDGISFNPAPVVASSKVHALICDNKLGSPDGTSKGKLDTGCTCEIDAAYVSATYQVSFLRNTVSGARSGIRVENAASVAVDSFVIIEDNILDTITGFVIVSAIWVKYMRTAYISRNHITNNYGIGIAILDTTRGVIEKNSIDGLGQVGVYLAVGIWISSVASASSVVRGNQILATNCGEAGHGSIVNSACVLVEKASGAEVSSNVLDASTGHGTYAYYGLKMTGVQNSLVKYNRILHTSVANMHLSQSVIEMISVRICNNRLEYSDNDLLVWSQSSDADDGQLVITGNHFGYVPASYAQVNISMATDVAIAHNVFGGETATVGRSIHFSSSGSYSDNIDISANIFDNIQGNGPTSDGDYGCVIYTPWTKVRSTTISSNVFRNCGYNNVGTNLYSGVIRSAAEYTSITGNIFYGVNGPLSTSGFSAAIHVVGRSTVTGNVFYVNVAASGFTLGTFTGVYIDGDYTVVTGNTLYITGTSSGSSQDISGILNNDKNYLTVNSNSISFWTNSGGGSNVAIDMGTAKGSSVVGNRSGYESGGNWYGYDIDCSAATDCIVVGNFTAGYMQLGTNANFGFVTTGINVKMGV